MPPRSSRSSRFAAGDGRGPTSYHFRTLFRLSFPCPSILPQAALLASVGESWGKLCTLLPQVECFKGSIFPALYAIGCSARCAGRRCCYSQVPRLRLWHSLYRGTCLSPLLHHSQSQTHQSSCHSNPAGLKSHHEPTHAKPPWKWHNQVCKTASSTCKNQFPPLFPAVCRVNMLQTCFGQMQYLQLLG